MRKGKKRETTVQMCDKGMGKDSAGWAYLEKEDSGVGFLQREEN